jgi:protein-S-isoprenylcysteine O-methyltransferase Ste14
VTRTLVYLAISPMAAAPVLFGLFWAGFAWWRRHRLTTYLMFAAVLAAFGYAAHELRAELFGGQLALPAYAPAIGWLLVAVTFAFALVADRQLGLHVRSFGPFFAAEGRIELLTTGAYGVVRHPLYAAGIGYQLGVFLISSLPAVALACAWFTLGALWFTRQEEKRLITLLADPTEYDRYRARVPALLPWPR